MSKNPVPTLDFWYEFASTYSYLSAMRVEDTARAAGVAVRWRPFLLGPIFSANGWMTSPFNLYPAKGRYMVRDIERIAGSRGLVFRLPDPFPQNGLLAARLALIGADKGWGPAFTRAVYDAEFAKSQDISRTETLSPLLADLGLDATALLERAAGAEVKARLRAQTDEAQSRAIFGAPSFTVGSELFWGDDRFDDAIALARG